MMFFLVFIPLFFNIGLFLLFKKNISVEKKILSNYFLRIIILTVFVFLILIELPFIKSNAFFKGYPFLYTLTGVFSLSVISLTVSFSVFFIRKSKNRNLKDNKTGLSYLWIKASSDIKLCKKEKEYKT